MGLVHTHTLRRSDAVAKIPGGDHPPQPAGDKAFAVGRGKHIQGLTSRAVGRSDETNTCFLKSFDDLSNTFGRVVQQVKSTHYQQDVLPGHVASALYDIQNPGMRATGNDDGPLVGAHHQRVFVFYPAAHLSGGCDIGTDPRGLFNLDDLRPPAGDTLLIARRERSGYVYLHAGLFLQQPGQTADVIVVLMGQQRNSDLAGIKTSRRPESNSSVCASPSTRQANPRSVDSPGAYEILS